MLIIIITLHVSASVDVVVEAIHLKKGKTVKQKEREKGEDNY